MLRSRKAFVMDFTQDVIGLIVLFVILTVIFIVFRIGASAEQQSVDDIRDLTFGNYMANVYLRTPVVADDMEYSMAELIAIYDHEQRGNAAEPEECPEGEECGQTDAEAVVGFFIGTWNLIIGEDNDLRNQIINLTNVFVSQNYPDDKCYYFAIHGSNFDFNIKGSSCPTAEAFSIYYLMSELDEVPDEVYKTYVAPVDPRDPPIEVYSIVDFERMLEIYTDDSYIQAGYYEQLAYDAMCRAIPLVPFCVERRIAATEAHGTEVGTALGKGIRRVAR